MDTMTMTKTVGAFCGALLIFLLGNWAAESLYHIGGGHGDEHHQAYTIETDGGGAAEEEVQQVSFDEVYAQADPAKGERVFSKCKACHKLEQGANATGPYLFNIVGRQVATASGFSYSGALVDSPADVWSPENLNHFLENPKGYAPGTAMSFAGLPDVEDRANLIAYLDTFH